MNSIMISAYPSRDGYRLLSPVQFTRRLEILVDKSEGHDAPARAVLKVPDVPQAGLAGKHKH